MKTELIDQYAHTWRTLAGIVQDFDAETWLHYGCGAMTPARDIFHLLQGVKYYTEDRTTVTAVLVTPYAVHLGELSSMLNESKQGVAEDNWFKTLHPSNEAD